MRHVAGALLVVFLAALPAFAVDLGRAEGTYSGTVSSMRIKTNTMTFSYDATFVAALR